MAHLAKAITGANGVNVKNNIIACMLALTCTTSFASGFHYCSGKVIDIVTRANNEETSIRIEGMNEFAKLNFFLLPWLHTLPVR